MKLDIKRILSTDDKYIKSLIYIFYCVIALGLIELIYKYDLYLKIVVYMFIVVIMLYITDLVIKDKRRKKNNQFN